MSSRRVELTPEKWEAAKCILLGQDNTKVSLADAAAAAGVTLPALKKWIKRACSKDPSDEPWVHAIADEIEHIPESQASVLESVLWDRAINGTKETIVDKKGGVTIKTKEDNALALRLLEKRDPSYVKGQKNSVDITARLDVDELFEKFQSLNAQLIAKQQNELLLEKNTRQQALINEGIQLVSDGDE